MEIFKRSDLTLRSWSTIQTPVISWDYITQEANSFYPLKEIEAEIGDIARVMDDIDGEIFLGIVSDTGKSGENIVNVKPMESLFDFQTFYREVTNSSGEIVQQTGTYVNELGTNGISKQYKSGSQIFSDGKYAIGNNSNQFIVEQGSGIQSSFYLPTAVTDAEDILSDALRKANVAAKFSMIFDDENAIKVEIKNFNTAGVNRTLDIDLTSIENTEINVSKKTTAVNKLLVFDNAGVQNPVVYYLKTDGTIEHSSTQKRIVPVVQQVKGLTVKDGESFSEKADELAEKTFSDFIYSTEISVTVKKDNKIFNWRPYENGNNFGAVYDLYYAGVPYQTIFTGFEESGETRTYLFGFEREELTKKLLIEKKEERKLTQLKIKEAQRETVRIILDGIY